MEEQRHQRPVNPSIEEGIAADTSGLSGQTSQDLGWGGQSRQDIRYISTGAGLVRIRDIGDGPWTLVMVADGPNMIEHYDRVLEALPIVTGLGALRVVCIDPPGTGFSAPAPGFRFTINEFSDCLLELLDHIGAEQCILAFGCVQAYMALRMANIRPDLVSKLILMQAARWPEEIDWLKAWIDPNQEFRRPVEGQLSYARARRDASIWWYDVCLGNDDDQQYAIHRTLDAYEHGACHCLASLTQQLLNETEPEFVNPVQETVVIWGLADRSHKDTRRESFLEYVPDAVVHEWSDAGHAPEIQQPVRFLEVVRDMIS